jgi:glutathione S-transferase
MKSPTLTLYQFPGCPFSERIEILLALKGLSGELRDVEIDISTPRPDWLLAKTGGATALPAFETPDGVLRESLVILRYLEMRFPARPVAQRDPWRHAVESMLVATDSAFTVAGYKMVQNQDAAQRDALKAAVDSQFARVDAFLQDYSVGGGPFLFEEFGWAEVAFTPLMKRLGFLDYYEGYGIPPALGRVRAWREACLAHPAAQRHTLEEVAKLYYDYSRGFGNGKVPPGRTKSSFTMEPHWRGRPMPPRDKWTTPVASDEALGLV